ncbi:disease resistance protein RGA5-like [Triticum aestivum]|uniref:disease resistance protein RGA5-like n=1 Tax=Triticum aestivum TaxID=4565 RepID=UPI001D011026|nr:disease resistance protein RGA5-like [Triticum aestivum]XP_044446236.1 disease resistance protein RGA5-like [Triticum aestivum]
MQDTIEDFMQSVDDRDAKPDGFMEKVKHELGKLGKINTRHRIGSEMQDLKKQFIEVGDKNACYVNLSLYKYFVVVDDIWDVDTWDTVKRAFPATSSTSRIITTTRMNSVAHLCCSSFNGHIYNIRALDMMHSRQLFHTRLFKSDEDFPSYLQEIAEHTLEKCDGLPLAVITISGLLANTERTENIWNQVKDSIGRALERNPSVEGMMKILSLSYFDLPAYLKTCLLYLSIYLEDSTIEKKDLVRRWIAEGFIHGDGRYTAYELGERYLNELLNRGLIQPGNRNMYGVVNSCCVHDTILGFIIFKSIEENFVTLLGVPILTIGKQSTVVHRLYLQGVEEGNSAVANLVLSHVRSIIVVRGLLAIPSLEEFRHLRVLNLKDCSQLEDHHLENIVRLFQLRYLKLEGTRISKLPEQIGRLGCLEVLNLRGTSIKELPASIVNLKKWMHLLVDYDVKFPDEIAKMQALETLKTVDASIQPLDFLCGLGQLMNLRNLRIDLDCEFDSDTVDTNMVGEEHNKAIVSSLCKLGTHNLQSLNIGFGRSLLHEESLCLPTLEDLSICFSAFPQVPTWVGSLRNLQRLCLRVEGLKQDDLSTLGALPSLHVLYLLGEIESNGKLKISSEVRFRFLKTFIYDACSEPVDLMFGTCSIPKLEKLELKYIRIVEANSLGFGIENLPCLTSVKCIYVDGDDGIVEAVKTVMERGASTHPNYPSLLFERLVLG